MPTLTKCRPLRPGGTIGIFSSGAPASSEEFERGVKTLEALGYRTRYIVDPSAHFADPARPITSHPLQTRLRSIEALVNDREVELFIAARGGYGTTELLPHLPFEQIKKAGKLFVGYSDITTLLVNLSESYSLATVHGSTVCSELSRYGECPLSQRSVQKLLSLVSDPSYRLESEVEPLRPGKARGRILAGNLTMLQTLLATPWDVDYNGAILCLEEIAEAPYRIHRLLLQLKLSNKLTNLAALVFGRFTRCELVGGVSCDEVIRQFIAEHLSHTTYPIFRSLSFGHEGENTPLPLGCLAEIRDTTLTLLESPLQPR